jgi:two-component system response regulator TctD
VLLVEDDVVSASALATILRRRGFDVSHVVTIAAAMDQLRYQPDFIVLDLMLPDGDGATVLRAVRDRGLHSRVLVLTAVSDPDRLTALTALKPDAFMQKPIDLARMLSLMQPQN